MLTTGVNDLALRSLINTEVSNSVSFNSMLYMFSGTPPTTLDELNLNSGNLAENIKSLIHQADGMCFPNFAIEKSGGQVKLNVANGDTGSIREKIGDRKSSYVPPTTMQVFDIQAAANRNLGDCVFYHPNNVWADWQAGTGLPALVIPAVLPIADTVPSIVDLTGKNCFSGKKIRAYAELDSWGLYLGRRGSTTSGVTNDSHRGHISIVFDEPVEADFLFMRMICFNNVTTRTFSNVSLILPDNSLVELTTFTASQNINYVLNFTKTLIKGLRLATTHQTFSANRAIFYLTQFTAGLKNWQTYPEFSDNTRDPFTWGILIPTADSVSSGLAERKLPLALVSIGDPASGADIELNGRSEHYIRQDCIVPKKFIELNL